MEQDAAASARPDDWDIQAQERAIRDEAGAVALVGKQEPLDSLKAQYASNPSFMSKVEWLATPDAANPERGRYAAMRRTRPDGNCFYRAYLYGIFEHLVGQGALLKAFTERASSSLDFCVHAKYDRVAIEDFCEEFCACLTRLGNEGASAATVDELLEECDGYLVCWARVLTSAFLKNNSEEFAVFLDTGSHASIQQFCAQEVDPMAKDADHLQITALSRYLGVPVTVVYLDQSPGERAAEHTFREEGAEAACPYPTVHLLYRPGHYDLIYPRAAAA